MLLRLRRLFIPQIPPSLLHAWCHEQVNVQILDVRTPEEYAAGHLAGSLLIPLQELKQRLAEVPRGVRIIALCHAGVRSAQATRLLLLEGIDVVNLQGGIVRWQQEGFAVEQLPKNRHERRETL